MKTYQEMVDALAAMDEQDRRLTIQSHWQAVFSDGFIAFVQGGIESGRKMVLSDHGFAEVFAELDPSSVAALKQQALRNLARLVEVWDCMAAMYEKLQQQSARQGNAKGMVAHGKHQAMPRGIGVTGAVQCVLCGSPVVSQGLCNGCLATQKDWEQDDLEYGQEQNERLANDLQYQRLRDDQIYHNNQRDFNSYTDYSQEY